MLPFPGGARPALEQEALCAVILAMPEAVQVQRLCERAQTGDPAALAAVIAYWNKHPDLVAVPKPKRARLLTFEGRSLPRDWAWPIERDEVVVDTVRVVRGARIGLIALVVKRVLLSRPDRTAREWVASRLAEILIAEVS